MNKENVIIKRVTYVTQKDGKQIVILHTTPTKSLKDKDGNPLVRFKLNRKVFAQRAMEVGQPEIIFAENCVGATYTYEYKAVKAGDAFINGEGTYTMDHNAKVSDSIEIAAATKAQTQAILTNAWAQSMFSNQPVQAPVSAPVVLSSKDEDESGSDIAA